VFPIFKKIAQRLLDRRDETFEDRSLIDELDGELEKEYDKSNDSETQE
jgi:hypothetical protein